ncbi:hypothetical protein BH23THE1_BH23THE1_27500 [soil metagenome]
MITLQDIKSAEDWADFWYYTRKVNVIPYDTKNRNPVIEAYKNYQYSRIPVETFEKWKKEGLFEKGMAIFPGKVYSQGDDQNYYLVAIDLDKKKAIDEYCKIIGKSFSELSERTIVEIHVDDSNRMHVYLLSPIPFPNKGPDSKIGIEVKSKAEHGIMFCCNSFHKNGYRYQITGTVEPWILTRTEAIEMIQNLNIICKRHGLEYVDKKTRINPEIKMMIEDLRIGKNVKTTIQEGERHSTLISIANSILFRHYLLKERVNLLHMNDHIGRHHKNHIVT